MASALVSASPEPIGSTSTSGTTPNRSDRSTRARVALVREPSSTARRQTRDGAVRKNSFTLITGPRQAMQASETIP